MSKVMLSIGHGYSAGALGRTLLADCWTIYGTTRSAEKAASLEAQGITPIIWPDTDLAPYNREGQSCFDVCFTNGRGGFCFACTRGRSAWWRF